MNRRRRDEKTSVIQYLPNVITLFSLCAGLTSIRLMMEGRIEHAIFLILLAAFLDAVDGKVARYLNCATPLGAELDSFADFFNFGIAPGLLIFNLTFIGQTGEYAGWFAVLILAMCCALRLARFNLSKPTDVSNSPDRFFFVGVPAPALAFLVLLPVYVYLSGYEDIITHTYLIAGHTAAMGALAISRIPTFSLKQLSIKAKWQYLFMLFAVLFLTLLRVFPWEVLIVMSIAYLASLPVSWARFQAIKKKTEPKA